MNSNEAREKVRLLWDAYRREKKFSAQSGTVRRIQKGTRRHVQRLDCQRLTCDGRRNL